MKPCATLVALVALACAARVQSSEILTESEFLEVLERHPLATAVEADAQAARALEDQAGRLANPVLALGSELPSDVPSQTTVALSWTPELHVRGPRIETARAAADAAAAEGRQTLWELRLHLRELYADWYVASERLSRLEADRERVGRFARWLEDQVAAGEASGLSVRRLALELAPLNAAVASARAEASGRRAAVMAWLEEPHAELRPEQPPLLTPPERPDGAARADLQALELRIAEARGELRQQGRWAQFPELVFGWTRYSDGPDGPVVGMSWPLPLLDRSQGSRQAAESRLGGAIARRELRRQTVDAELAAAGSAYAELRKAVLETEFEDTASIEEAILEAFAAGEASLTDLLDTARSIREARLARLDLLELALAGSRRLEAATGQPLSAGGRQ